MTSTQTRPSVRNDRHAGAATGDDGMALVVTLLLMLALSSIGASLLLAAQTETYASMNYRMMSQARYGAEAGVLRAVNYLTQTYQTPGTAGDPYAQYDVTQSPVRFNNQPVILSADPAVPSNYPSSAKQAAFSAAVQGSLNATQTVNYRAYATLVSMRTIEEYGAVTPRVVQTWRVTGTGAIAGIRPATVEVSSTLEQNITAAHSFGVFATKTGCGALTFGGGSVNDSYDSANITFSGGVPVTQASGGSVGTNGNLTVNGNGQVWGTLSTPKVGVGKCKNGSVTALSGSTYQVSEGMIQLPQALSYPPPAPPSPMPPTTNVSWSGSTCAQLGLAAPTCTGTAGNITLDPQGGTLAFGNVTLNSGGIVHLRGGTYNLNSIKINGNATLIVDNGPIFMNVAGVGTNNPIDFMGGSLQNPTYDPTMFHVLYGGTNDLTFTGSASTAAMVYAPLAAVTVAGGSHFYGSIVGSEVKDTGGAQFHYDRRLKNDFMVAGNYIMSAFTWRKY